MSRSYTSSLPHVPPWRVAGQLYLFLLFTSSFWNKFEHDLHSVHVVCPDPLTHKIYPHSILHLFIPSLLLLLRIWAVPG
jgi:hypothetical protein